MAQLETTIDIEDPSGVDREVEVTIDYVSFYEDGIQAIDEWSIVTVDGDDVTLEEGAKIEALLTTIGRDMLEEEISEHANEY